MNAEGFTPARKASRRFAIGCCTAFLLGRVLHCLTFQQTASIQHPHHRRIPSRSVVLFFATRIGHSLGPEHIASDGQAHFGRCEYHHRISAGPHRSDGKHLSLSLSLPHNANASNTVLPPLRPPTQHRTNRILSPTTRNSISLLHPERRTPKQNLSLRPLPRPTQPPHSLRTSPRPPRNMPANPLRSDRAILLP